MRLLFIFSLFFCSSYALGGPSDLISCKKSWQFKWGTVNRMYIDYCLYIRTYDTNKKFAIITIRRTTETTTTFKVKFDFHASKAINLIEISDDYDPSFDYSTVFGSSSITAPMNKHKIENSLELNFNGSPKVYVFKTENDSALPRFTVTHNSASWHYYEEIFKDISVSDKSFTIKELKDDACVIDIQKGTGSHVFLREKIPNSSFAKISIKNTGSKNWTVNFRHAETSDILRSNYIHQNVYEDDNGQKVNPQDWMPYFTETSITTSDTERIFYLAPSYSMRREDLPSGTYTSILEITCD